MTAARRSKDELLALHAEACALAAAAFGVSRKALLQARTRKASFARQVAMYLTHMLGVKPTQVGVLFDGRIRATVHHALAVVEDARDDAALDAKLDALETTLHRRLGRDQTIRHRGLPPRQRCAEDPPRG